MAFVPFDGELDKEPTSFVPFDGELDAPEKEEKKENRFLSPDLPLGMIENATTGTLNALGGLGAGVIGSLGGIVNPNSTAKAGFEKGGQMWNDTAGKVLAPRSESGKAAEELMAKGIESFKEYAGDKGPKELLGAIPFVGDRFAKDERIAGAVSGLATALPEISMVTPFLGLKKGQKPVAEAPKSTADAVFKETKEAASNMDAKDLRVARLREKAATEAKAAWERKQQTLIGAPEGILRPEDVPFRDRAATAMEADLNRMSAETAKADRPGLTSLEGPDGQMSLFDQPDVMGQRNQFNGGELGDWRIDENGMPVKVDKSMEALNLEQPLQRNLFGDELGPALGQDVSLTQAIDNTPANGQWAQRRGQINRLGGRGQELMADPALEAAMLEAEGMKLPMIDQTMFDPKNPLPTERLGAIQEGPSTPGIPPTPETPPTAPGGPSGASLEFPELSLAPLGENLSQKPFNPNSQAKDGSPIQIDRSVSHNNIAYKAMDADGNVVAQVSFEQNPDGSIGAGHVQSFAPGKGLAESLYRKAKEDGFTIRPGRAQTEQGAKMVEALQRKGLIEPGEITPTSQYRQDVIDSTSPSETRSIEALPPSDRPIIVDTVAEPRSLEKIQERKELRRAEKHMPTNLNEFEPVRTKEEAKQLALDDGMQDKAPGFVGRNAGSGVNWAAAMTNNPLIKFANTVFRDARTNADKFSRTYITSKDGLSPTWSKMNGEERVGVADALMAGDRNQMRVTPEIMDKLGFSDLQRQWVDRYYKANDAMFDRWNEVLTQLNMKAVPKREGHVPGIFKGAYKALVMDANGVQGVIAVDSKYQLAAAKEYFAKNNPDFKIVEQARKGLADYRNQSDIFSGMNDVIALLAENDPRFAEVQAMVSEAIKHGNNSMFAFNKHELSKKGVVGNEGNKPWQDKKANTEDWYKAMVQYFEEGALHHELQKPLKDVKELVNDPDLNMPKTAKYLDSYTKHVTGQNASNPVAMFGNYAIDLGPKLLGFGPRQSLQLAGQVKNRMSQLFMGWGNWMFTAAQMAQPMQTGLPFLQMAAGRLGKDLNAPKSMANGGIAFLRGTLEHMTGKDLGQPAHMKEAYQYAMDRGMLTFSEMERAYEGAKSKVGRAVDRVAEANMKAGEVTTRTPMFLSFVDMLHSAGVPTERALPIAENMTQLSMIDYHQWERPQMYAKMGTVGQFAGGLTTFKHGFVGMQGKLGKELGRDANVIRNAAPIGISAGAAVALAGITGMPFYDELDNLFGEISDKFMDERKNIRDTVLSNLPEWANSGAIANASGVGIQSKFSSANMVPDTVPKALSPQLDALGKIVMDAVDVARYGDDQAWANLMMDISPSTFKGLVEDTMLTDETGLVHNRNMQGTVERSPEDRALRKWTGLRPHNEVLEAEKNYKARTAVKADEEAKNKLSARFGRGMYNDKVDVEALDKYQKRGGDATSLINRFKERAIIEKNSTEKDRRDLGFKPTPSGLREYDYYNKPGER